MSFRDGFLWGAATAAYQIEGAAAEDGRGPSIWDTFCRLPGAVRNGDTGDVACDHYHRYAEDVGLMRRLGLGAYRFSVSWPRVMPAGRGPVNEPGLAFYDRLVDALLEAGIAPFVTLYHWDLPQALQDEGGWPNRTTADAFADYAGTVAARLGDRVRYWATLNEPAVAALFGHYVGIHAPGVKNPFDALRASHHMLVGHGKAVAAVRAAAGAGARVGLVNNLLHVEPASDREEDAAAARRFDGLYNRWYLDPVFRGEYPPDLAFAAAALPVEADDMATISAPIDFLGVNYYTRQLVAESDEDPVLRLRLVPPEGGRELTDMDWEVYPEGLYEALTRVSREYAPREVFVTESGAAYRDEPVDGRVEDPRRRAYLEAHVDAARRAAEAGVPLGGYFVWSLLDNFEWAEGYSKRFGLVYVDYATQARTIKQSAEWYAGLIARR
jgi:beta-glucosidase